MKKRKNDSDFFRLQATMTLSKEMKKEISSVSKNDFFTIA
jgi:hypothetical protein